MSKKEEIVNKYIELAFKLGHHPTRAELIESGISRDQMKFHFGNFTKLQQLVIKSKQISDIPVNKIESSPRILVFDIETAPFELYGWGLRDQNFALNQIKEDWSVLSWAAKWYDLNNDAVMYEDVSSQKDIRKDKKLLNNIWKLLDQADIVITQNGEKFDAKKLNARFLLNGMGLPSSYRHLDTCKISRRKYGFTSNKLEYLTEKLCKKYKKLKHKEFPGQDLWTACLQGNPKAWSEMQKYNKHDVLATEELYSILAPHDNTINFSVYKDHNVCKCGSQSFSKNGFSYTNSSKFQRYKCDKCGSESRGKKNLLVNKKLNVGIK